MSAKKSTPKTDRKALFTAYMTYTLEHEQYPRSIYKFCKEQKIKEADFYNLFGSLEGVKKGIWKSFFDQSLDALQADKQYETYGNREKMLGFFFTFFELLNLNRSYVLFALEGSEGNLKQLRQLSDLRAGIKSYATELLDTANSEKSIKIAQYNTQLFSEGAWLQLLFLIRFWMKDDSAGFEKTDVAIEKSVNTIFDVFDNTPLERVVDFGKFLFQERFSFN